MSDTSKTVTHTGVGAVRGGGSVTKQYRTRIVDLRAGRVRLGPGRGSSIRGGDHQGLDPEGLDPDRFRQT